VGTDAAAADAGRGTVSRRSVLTASAVAASGALPLLLTACKGVQALGTPPPPAPDIVALRTAILAEEALLSRYAAVVRLASTPAGSGVVVTAITTVRAEHVAHLAQLKSRLVEPAGGTPFPTSSAARSSSSSSPSASASGSPRPTKGGPVTGTLPAALAALEAAEQAASDRLIGQLGVLPASLAQLFASVAASEAAHVPYLRAAARRGL
jgi:hypothetical protein